MELLPAVSEYVFVDDGVAEVLAFVADARDAPAQV